MRHLLTGFLVIVLGTLAIHVLGQTVDSNGLQLPVRVTGTIPAYIDLQVFKNGADSRSQDNEQTVRMVVRANCPWELKARLVGAASSSGHLQQCDVTAAPVYLKDGQPIAIPCKVKHFAGEQIIQFTWTREAIAAPPGTASEATLQLWLETKGQREILSTAVQSVSLFPTLQRQNSPTPAIAPIL